MNYLDLISSAIIILAIFLIPKSKKWWLLYALGCLCWIVLCFTKGLYFGIAMNTIALIIGLRNARKTKANEDGYC